MATVRDVVTLMLRQARIVGVGREPRSAEAERGLEAFQGLLDFWIGNGMFGRLTDVYKTDDYTATEGDRVIAPTAITVTFPTSIVDEGTGETRAPYDLSIVETVLNGTRVVKIYDRTAWVDLLGLTLASDAPLASRGLPGLAACAAQSYVEMFGGSLGPLTQRLGLQFQGMISHKFGSTRPKEAAGYY